MPDNIDNKVTLGGIYLTFLIKKKFGSVAHLSHVLINSKGKNINECIKNYDYP